MAPVCSSWEVMGMPRNQSSESCRNAKDDTQVLIITIKLPEDGQWLALPGLEQLLNSRDMCPVCGMSRKFFTSESWKRELKLTDFDQKFEASKELEHNHIMMHPDASCKANSYWGEPGTKCRSSRHTRCRYSSTPLFFKLLKWLETMKSLLKLWISALVLISAEFLERCTSWCTHAQLQLALSILAIMLSPETANTYYHKDLCLMRLRPPFWRPPHALLR